MRNVFLIGLLLFLLFSFTVLHSQDWQSTYDEAVQAFEQQNHRMATDKSIEALSLLGKNEHKAAAYTHQLMTTALIELGDFEKGLLYSTKEMKSFERAEGKDSDNYIKALEKQTTCFRFSGKAEKAFMGYSLLADLKREEYTDNSYEFLKNEIAWGELLTSQRRWDEAIAKLQPALPALQQFPEGGEEYIFGLFALAQAHLGAENTEEATAAFKKFISLLDNNDLTDWPEYKQAKTLLGKMPPYRGGVAEKKQMIDDSNSSSVAVQLLKAGLQKASSGEVTKAREFYKKGITLVEAHNIRNNTSFSLYFNTSELLLKMHQNDEAQKYWQKANDIAVERYEQISQEMAYLARQKGDIAYAKNQSLQANEAYDQCITICEQLPIDMASPFFKNIINSRLVNYEFEAAIDLVKKYISHPEISKADPTIRNEILLKGYEALLQAGHFSEGITFIKAQNEGFTPKTENAPTLLILARMHIGAGSYTSAENILTRLQQQYTDDAIQAESNLQLGRLKQVLADYNAAEIHYKKAINAFGKLEASAALTDAQNSLAAFYITLGNYEAAEEYYQKLIHTTDKASPFYADIAQNMASVYQMTGRYKQAEVLLKEVLDIDQVTVGENDPKYAISLQNLASVYHKTGKLPEAKLLYEEAMEVDRALYGPFHPSYGTKINNLAVIHQELGNDDKALSLFNEALTIRKAKLGAQHPAYAFSLFNLAVLHQKSGNSQVAAPLFEEMKTIYLKQINEIFPALSEKEKTAFYHKIEAPIDAYLDFAIHHARHNPATTGTLFDFRLATKAILLNSTSKVRRRILTSGDEYLISRFNRWTSLKDQLAKLYTASSKNVNQKEIENLEKKANDLEKLLSRSSTEFAGAFDQPATSWKEIKADLNQGEAALEIIRLKLNTKNDSVIYAGLLLKADSHYPELIVLKNGKELEEREFRRYINYINFLVENDGSFNEYWKPIDEKMSDIHTLYISPDGVYNKINLNTLYDVTHEQYLIEKLTIKQVSNLRELIRVKKPPATSNLTASLFGYPSYRTNQDGPELVDNGTNNIIGRKRSGSILSITEFEELPGTKEELERIEKLLKGNGWACHMYLRDDADEVNMKKTQNPTVLHIATHGYFQAQETSSFDLTSQFSILKSGTLNANPLLQSGLVLAHAETKNAVKQQGGNLSATEEDGILTAYEAMNLSLDKTELVVLSACETGAGKVKNGEGVYGFQRSFLLAGAQNVLMSLWKVEDRVTQELMVEFYSQWLQGKDKSTAFRDTQLILKEKYNTPYHWGAFIMIGE